MEDIAQYFDINVTESDLNNGVVDEQGVIYSDDGNLLLGCRNPELTFYTVKNDCKIVCNEAFFRFMPSECKLERIAFHDGLMAIGHEAFNGCSHLRTVVLPDSLRFIGDLAFNSCPLDSLSIPSGMESMGSNPFGLTSMIHVESRSSHFKFIDGCLMNDDTMVAWLSDEDYCRVPKGTRKIGNMAFLSMDSCHTIQLPEGLEEIGDYVFLSENLDKLVIPSTVKIIGKNSNLKIYENE